LTTEPLRGRAGEVEVEDLVGEIRALLPVELQRHLERVLARKIRLF
jgi:hypothetical protein